MFLTVVQLTDKLLYALLGDGESERAGLAKLVDEGASPVGVLLQKLLGYLEDCSAGAEHWLLLSALGGDFSLDKVRVWARQLLLQTASATFEFFEHRLSHPPFTLFKLGDDRVPARVQRDLADQFLYTNEHCLSLFCCRLRKLYPTRHALLEHAPAVMRALDGGSEVCIDSTERLHASLRLELRSTGAASSFAVGANRLMCSQLRAAHQQLTECDPAVLPLPSLAEETVRPRSKSTGCGGNPKLEFRNHKLKTHKAMVAAEKPLTQHQLAA